MGIIFHILSNKLSSLLKYSKASINMKTYIEKNKCQLWGVCLKDLSC